MKIEIESTPREKLRRLAHGWLEDCDDMILMADSWADNRPEEPPLDVEPCRIIHFYAQKMLDAIDSGQRIDPAWLDRIRTAANE